MHGQTLVSEINEHRIIEKSFVLLRPDVSSSGLKSTTKVLYTNDLQRIKDIGIQKLRLVECFPSKDTKNAILVKLSYLLSMRTAALPLILHIAMHLCTMHILRAAFIYEALTPSL